MKKLIVTADDYGVFPSINEGVKTAIRNGKVNSIACFSNHTNSVKNVKEIIDEFGNTVDIGCHFTLSSGKPLIVNNNSAFTHGDYFKDFSNLDIDGIEKQLPELKKELVAQVEVFKDNGINVNHLSCHCNTLTTVKSLFEVYLDVAHQFNIPMRSVNIQPSKQDSNYRIVLDILLADNVPLKKLKEIRRFKNEINKIVQDYQQVKTPNWLESSHYGPIPMVVISELGIERRKREKHESLHEFLTEFNQSEYTVAELMTHLINYEDYLRGVDEDIDYPGVNTKYFDSRQIELKSLLEFNFNTIPDITMGGWDNLK